MPFSLDSLTGSSRHDFMFRSLGGARWSPVVTSADGPRRTEPPPFSPTRSGVFDSGDAVAEATAFFDDDQGRRPASGAR